MNKLEINKYIANSDLTIVEAMRKIDQNGNGILFIVDSNQSLMASITDGDIRRWLIKTGNLDTDITPIMQTNPRFLHIWDRTDRLNFMAEQRVKAIPIVDSMLRIVDIAVNIKSNNEASYKTQDALTGTSVVIMAGGKGTRLYPYTKILPKPLIPIGDVPILERIMNRFHRYGAMEFFLTVNYRKEMIKSYFAEQNLPYKIHYIEENEPLGTAGSIALIEEDFAGPVIITNCDILIEADYSEILRFHKESGNAVTIVSSLKNIVIPYGVLYLKENGIVTSMKEKPQYSHLINTGMYIVDPEYLKLIPKGKVYHMTDLAEAMIREGNQVGMYPISEDSFLDMGEFGEMKRMEERVSNGSEES